VQVLHVPMDKKRFEHLNAEPIPLVDGISTEIPEVTWIDVTRAEYERMFYNFMIPTKKLLEEEMQEEKHYMVPVIQRFEEIGRVKEKLSALMEHDIFDDLSKHNIYYHSEHEIEYDKLFDLRMKIAGIQDSLCNIYDILHRDDEKY
jgi:hypothetical protein